MHSNGSDIITWGITTRKWVKNQGLISFIQPERENKQVLVYIDCLEGIYSHVEWCEISQAQITVME